jgi:hypothetical protein
MKLHSLLVDWEKKSNEECMAHECLVKMPRSVAARIYALQEMFPGRSENEIIAGLLSSVLDELLETLPYVQGETVAAEDELGDPMYEDVGLTPRFIRLTQKYVEILAAEQR